VALGYVPTLQHKREGRAGLAELARFMAVDLHSCCSQCRCLAVRVQAPTRASSHSACIASLTANLPGSPSLAAVVVLDRYVAAGLEPGMPVLTAAACVAMAAQAAGLPLPLASLAAHLDPQVRERLDGPPF